MHRSTWIYIGIAVLLIFAAAIFIRYKTGGSSENNNYANQQNMNDQNSSNQSAQNVNPVPNQSAAPAPSAHKVTTVCANEDFSGKSVVLNTTMGSITIQLYASDAPKTVKNFACLAQQGYYDGIIFHRVAHGFVIQAGDPTGTGAGGDSIYGSSFADELNPATASYKAGYVKGVVAMANKGPNTNSSQFFIMTADVPLPHSYTIFGKVTSGQDVVDKIGAVPVVDQSGAPADDGKPVDTITINKATVQ